MTTFDLHAVVRSHLEARALANPAVIAEQVAQVIPSGALRTVVAELLPAFVRSEVGRQRHDAIESIGSTPRKAAALDWYQRFLRQRVDVGVDDPVWKFLGDCTRDDVLAAAAKRRALAGSIIAVAERFETLANLMQRRRAKTVDDLPADALLDVVGEAA